MHVGLTQSDSIVISRWGLNTGIYPYFEYIRTIRCIHTADKQDAIKVHRRTKVSSASLQKQLVGFHITWNSNECFTSHGLS